MRIRRKPRPLGRGSSPPITDIITKGLIYGTILGIAAFLFSTQVGENQVSPPLIFIGFVIPFIILIIKETRKQVKDE